MSTSRRALSRWLVLGLLLATLLVLLGAQGLSTRTTGRSATPAPSNGGPLSGQGPILAWSDGRLQSRDVDPGKRIALTFDDGPSPRWTPRIAAALTRLHVPATFFVVGSEVVRHPDVVRRLHREGFELGNHTFTHGDVAALPGWEQRLQIGLTDNALAGTVGIRPRLFRPPYSSVPASANARQAAHDRGDRARAATTSCSPISTVRIGAGPESRRSSPRPRRRGRVEASSCSTTEAATARRPCARSSASFRNSARGASAS